MGKLKTYKELFDITGHYITDTSYKEIFKLHNMLEGLKIPHTFTKMFDGWHIEYPNKDYRVCSVIEHNSSYGSEKDLLEIMGLVSIKEADDGVLGYLTAEEVFKRIKEHYINNNYQQ